MAESAKKQVENYEVVEPNAASMIESLRAFGYNLQTAIADLIDNSISAGAKNIWLNFFWNGPDSFFSLRDDGTGMSEAELKEAMRAGSRSPLEDRDPSDLGRFGLGLKTASFSQSRRLTVRSKRKGQKASTRRWDLDYVNATREWRLLKAAEAGSENHISSLDDMKHGTVVLWECMDRVVKETTVESEVDHRRFLDLIDDVQQHIAMVFHRFLSPPTAVRIFINGKEDKHRVKPWDPFLEDHSATQPLPLESIAFRRAQVRIRPFVLPHHDMLGPEMHQKASGPAGWNLQQGFYIYRNKRLLVAGDWLGLGFAKEEHYKLARIQIDIPNSLDGDWNIDVKKSRARPPASLRDRLKFIADQTRKRAVEVYRHRGKYEARKKSDGLVFAWRPEKRKGKVVYLVNREHPLVKRALEAPKEFRPVIDALLRLLEETVPVQQIWLDTAELPEGHGKPFETVSERDIKSVMVQVYMALRRTGLTAKEAKSRILLMEAFAPYPNLVEALGDEIDETK